MRAVGYEESLAGYSELPEGYNIELENALEEESGENHKVLLLKRPDGSVAWVFPFGASQPMADEVSRRAWDDHRASGVGWRD